MSQGESDEKRAECLLSRSRKPSDPCIVTLVPAFNEEENISEVIHQAYKFSSRVLVCDDGSTDSTYRLSLDSGAEVIRHECNLGYGAALRSLFLRAKYMPADAFVTIDSDGQHDSRFIPAITDFIVRREADLVIGSRFLSAKLDFTPSHRKVAIKLITSLVNLTGQTALTDLQSGFRAYNSRALSIACPCRAGMGASTEIVRRAMRSGLRIREIPVPVYYRGRQPSLLSTILQFLDVLRSTLGSNYGIPSPERNDATTS